MANSSRSLAMVSDLLRSMAEVSSSLPAPPDMDTGQAPLDAHNRTYLADHHQWNYSFISTNDTNITDTLFFLDGFSNPFDKLHVKAIFITLYSIVFGFCFFGNLLVVFTVLMHRKMRTVTNFFLANLAVADLCVGIFCILPSISLYVSRDWKLGKVMCKVYYFVQAMSYAASIIILTVISIERYFAILHPFRCKMLTTIFLLRVVVLLIWLIAAGCGIPFLIFYEQVQVHDSKYFCINTWRHHYDQNAYTIVNFVLWYIVPLLLMTVMYTQISIVLWKSSRTDGSSMLNKKCSKEGNKSFKITFKKHFKRQASASNDDSCSTKIEHLERSHTKSGCLAYSPSHCLGDFVRDEDELSNAADSSDSNTYKIHRQTARCETEEEMLSTMSANEVSDIDDINAESKNLTEKCDQSRLKGNKEVKNMPLIRKALSNGLTGRGSMTHGVVNTPHNNSRRFLTRNMPPRSVRFSEMARQERGENALLARRRVIRLLVAIIVAFALCVLPNHIRLLWEIYSLHHHTSEWTYLIPPIVYLIFYLNSALNPILYAFLSDNFRKSLRELFGRFLPDSQDKARSPLGRKNNFSTKTNHTLL